MCIYIRWLEQHRFRGLSKEFLANALNPFDPQVVVVYDQHLLCPRAVAVCEARGGSLGLVAAAAAPKRGLMRPLLAFLKDRLCWWSRLDGATFQNTCQQDCGRRLNFVTMITYICQKKWRKTFENCQNICRKRVRIYFKIEAEIRAKETVSIHLLKYVRIHTSETGSQR